MILKPFLLHPSLWKSCLPWNQPLMPKRLGTAALQVPVLYWKEKQKTWLFSFKFNIQINICMYAQNIHCGKSKTTEKNLCANKKKLAKNTGESILRNTAAACCQVAPVLSDSVRSHGLQPTRLLRPWDSPGKNTGVGCHFLLQFSYRAL